MYLKLHTRSSDASQQWCVKRPVKNGVLAAGLLTCDDAPQCLIQGVNQRWIVRRREVLQHAQALGLHSTTTYLVLCCTKRNFCLAWHAA